MFSFIKNILIFICLFINVEYINAENEFEIYWFNVGQGAAQLIRFPSGYSILIDTGQDVGFFTQPEMAELVAEQIKTIVGELSVNVVVVSHGDLDHVGKPEKGGVWWLIEKSGLKIKDKIVDRNSGLWIDKKKTNKCGDVDDDDDFKWINAGRVSATLEQWLCYATSGVGNDHTPMTTASKLREVVQVGSKTQIQPPDDGATVTIVYADGQRADGKTIPELQGDSTSAEKPFGENEYSIVLLIEFGNLKYVTGSDIGGVSQDSDSFLGLVARKYDVESFVAEYFDSPVDVMSVNHHGSQHSTNENWLNALKPSVATISCGTTIGHPRQEVLDRLAQHNVDVYVTQQCRDGIETQTRVVGGKFIKMSSKTGNSYKLFDANGDAIEYKTKSQSRPTSSTTIANNNNNSTKQTHDDEINDANNVPNNQVLILFVLLMLMCV